MPRRFTIIILAIVCCGPLLAQAPKKIAIRAGKLIDGKSDQPIANALIVIADGKIVSVTPGGSPPADAEVIDLSHATVLPGFMDVHTHTLLNGDVTAQEYDEQLLKESIPYRAILAARNARIALDHGFTTIRDLETEGAMYADVDVKTAINRGEVPGPRMVVSTRAMAPTGMYPLLGYSWELDLPHGVQPVDGVDGARLAVREQVMHGADWIKYYSDHGYFFTPDGVLHSHVNFRDDEARAIVEEAHRIGHKVAAHAIGSDGIAAALRAGVDSIEHGDGFTDELLDQAVKNGVYWCPTIMVGAYVAPGRGGAWNPMVEAEKKVFQKAMQKHVKIVLGTDVGRISLDQAERSARIQVLRRLRHEPDERDPHRYRHSCGNAGLERPPGNRRSRQARGHRRRFRRSAGEHQRTREREIRDEGRRCLQERAGISRRTLVFQLLATQITPAASQSTGLLWPFGRGG